MEEAFWHDRWESGRIGFHREQVNPHLVRWWPESPMAKSRRVLVPLCGKSVDLHWLAHRHQVVGVDLSPIAIAQYWQEADLTPELSETHGFARSDHGQLTLLCGDFTGLQNEDCGSFDGFYDRAAIIALPPDLRLQYVDTLKRVVAPGGRGLMVTVEYPQADIEGPPFSVPPSRVAALFEPDFQVELWDSEDILAGSRNLVDRGVTALKEHVFHLSRR